MKISVSLLILFLLISAAYRPIADLQEGKLRVTAIDVGQGAATLVRFPQGVKMLIDGGGFYEGSFDIGRYVLAPYLWHEKIGSLDVLVMTHVHPDHLNGLIFIAKNFSVGEVWMSGHIAETDSYLEFMRIIKEKNIPVRIVSAETQPFALNGVKVDIFNPEHPLGGQDGAETFEDINNQSIVMKFTFGKIGVLLPADISHPTEDHLVRTGADLQSQILFVPHHGGRTSSRDPFLDAVHPRFAVVSSGHENVFRDPHPEVLQRYAARGVQIFRTDRNGAVTLATDGQEVHVETFKTDRSPAMRWPGDADR